jgi:hypothetical protein
MYETGGSLTILGKISFITFAGFFLAWYLYFNLPTKYLTRTSVNVDKVVLTSGTWSGEYFYGAAPSVKFSIDLKEDAKGTISGHSKERVNADTYEQTIESEWSGNRVGRLVKLNKAFTFNNAQQKIRYEGTLNAEESTINGTWSILGSNRNGTFKLRKDHK